MSKEREFRGRMRWFGCRFRFVVYGGSRERKNRFIKDDIPRYVNSANSNIKAFETFVKIVITEKHTLF